MSQLLASTARKQVFLALFFGSLLGVVLGGGVLVAQIANSGLVQPEPTHQALIDATPQPTTQPSATSTVTVIASPTTTSTPRPPTPTRMPTRAPTIDTILRPIQASVLLRGLRHEYQKFNNCGPTTLAMNLSHFGKPDTQAQVAAFTKPNAQDKNVRPDEMAAYASRAGLRSVIRVNGTFDQLKLFLSNDLPVIVETGLVKEPQGWMGHYRLVIGHDARQFTTMDSYDGASVKIASADLEAFWRQFNRTYIVIYAEPQEPLVRAILGDALDDQTMYTQAIARARAEIQADPQDAFAQFNLGSSLVGLKRYAEAATAFDRARTLGLPWRMLWYQFEPFEAYLQTQQFDKTLALANEVLSKAEDLEEAHYYKGLALRALGRTAEARRAFETALKYNKNFNPQSLCPACPQP